MPPPFSGPPPVLHTARLVLRPYALADAADVQRLAGDRRVAATTAHIPHPYPDGAAEEWIATHAGQWASGAQLACAVAERDSGRLVGSVGLVVTPSHERAELGYWIGVESWGRGYATEAARALCGYAFTTLGLRRIVAHHLATNPASGRVMEKLGMQREGVLRSHDQKWGTYHDIVVYGVLATEWSAGAVYEIA